MFSPHSGLLFIDRLNITGGIINPWLTRSVVGLFMLSVTYFQEQIQNLYSFMASQTLSAASETYHMKKYTEIHHERTHRGEEEEEIEPLPLMSLNHVSRLCRSVEDSMDFYEKIMGFVPIKRPGTFNFGGAWLFNYGVGIHLVECKNLEDLPAKKELNPLDNHISFQCEDMNVVEKKLKKRNIKYLRRTVEEGGERIDQLFFHDPDCFMIEVCDCEKLTLVPLCSCSTRIRLPPDWHSPPIALENGEQSKR